MESQREETAMFLTKEFMAKYYAMEGSIGQYSGLSSLSGLLLYAWSEYSSFVSFSSHTALLFPVILDGAIDCK